MSREIYELSSKYGFFNRVIIFDTLSSTQDYALEKGERGDVVVARTQTHGRGRFNRKWYSPRGGLWFSVVLKSNGINSIEACLAVLRILKRFLRNVGIKYPNDIFVNGKKICGIIAEVRNEDAVVGIGINVNNSLPEFLNATSLKEETGKEHDTFALLLEILEEYERVMNMSRKRKIGEFRENQIILGKKIKVQLIKEEIIGTAVNIDENFNLVLIVDGEIVKINAGDVFLID